jgi:hypothetical protein
MFMMNIIKETFEEKIINFDLDGTLANFYGVEGWLDDLINRNTRPYEIAKPLFNFSALARILNRLRRNGYIINIISWCAKNSTPDFDENVKQAKINWLNKHLKSVEFDNIYIVPYGTPKQTISKGILFDDEFNNRKNWTGMAFDVDNILEELKKLK